MGGWVLPATSSRVHVRAIVVEVVVEVHTQGAITVPLVYAYIVVRVPLFKLPLVLWATVLVEYPVVTYGTWYIHGCKALAFIGMKLALQPEVLGRCVYSERYVERVDLSNQPAYVCHVYLPF
jgi:hypothetical protein